MSDAEALRAALSADDALVVGKYTLHGTDNGTAHFTYLNDVGKPRGLWTPADALIPAQTILALLAERDRLLAVAEAAEAARVQLAALVAEPDNPVFTEEALPNAADRECVAEAYDRLWVALDELTALKEHADAR